MAAVGFLGSATLTGWSTTGNAGSTPTNNFLGTIDDQPLSFKLFNTNAGKWDHQKGDYFIGLNTGDAITTGYSNIGISTGTLAKTNTGKGNTSIGHFGMNYNTFSAIGVPNFPTSHTSTITRRCRCFSPVSQPAYSNVFSLT